MKFVKNNQEKKEVKGVNNPTSTSGFTIVELLVAMSVFAVLLMVAVGVFVRVIRTQRNLVHRMNINNNAGSVLEQITRDIRTGYNFCPNDFENGEKCDFIETNSLIFTNRNGNSANYFLEDEAVKKDSVQLTASDIEIKRLKFIIRQDSVCDPWRVTILMGVGSSEVEQNQYINLQATVSSRILPRETPGAPQSVIDKCRRL